MSTRIATLLCVAALLHRFGYLELHQKSVAIQTYQKSALSRAKRIPVNPIRPEEKLNTSKAPVILP
jgi:hypothetical protein